MNVMAEMTSNKSFVVVTVLFILLVSIDMGLSIKCWKCRSDTDPKCADPFDNSTVPINDCQQEPELPHLKGVKSTMCRKVRQKVDGQWRYIRGCAYIGEVGIEGDERFCLMRTGTYNIFIEYCTCNSKDGCNGASGLAVSYGVIVVLCLAAWQWSNVYRVLR